MEAATSAAAAVILAADSAAADGIMVTGIMGFGHGIMLRDPITMRRAHVAASSIPITGLAGSAVRCGTGKVETSHDLAANAKSE